MHSYYNCAVSCTFKGCLWSLDSQGPHRQKLQSIWEVKFSLELELGIRELEFQEHAPCNTCKRLSTTAIACNPARILQSRRHIFGPSSQLLPSIVLSPSLWKQQKLNYRKPTAETALFTDSEGKNTSHHMSPSVAIALSPTFLRLLLFSSLSISLSIPRSKWGILHILVLRHGITSTLLSFSLSLNKMIHFSIMAMSVWNELYNQ